MYTAVDFSERAPQKRFITIIAIFSVTFALFLGLFVALGDFQPFIHLLSGQKAVKPVTIILT
jgi:hypothetical protein